MLKRFTVAKVVDIPAFTAFNENLSEILEKLDNGFIMSEGGYTYDDFKELLQSIVTNQRDSLGRTKAGSWTIVPDDKGMDSDCRVEFIFKPTYLVTAILSRTLCEYPFLALSIPGYYEALRQGMTFCAYRGLRGHGYEAETGAAEASSILSLGKVPILLEKEPSFCPDLYEAIGDVTSLMIE